MIEEESQPEESRNAKPWLEMITDAEKAFSAYQDKMDNISDLYGNLEKMASVSQDREFQIFWANLEVLKPSIFSRAPVPVVTPRFKDRRELPTMASELLERSLITIFERDDILSTLKMVRDDLALGARGVPWLRLSGEESVQVDHVDRRDFLHAPARKWKEVGWVARRSWLTRKKGLQRFGDLFLKAEFKKRDGDDEQRLTQTAPVWELWSKDEGVVVWVSPGMDEVLDIQPPILDLEGFFPCPRPAYGTLQPGKMVPIPDFVYYRDQVEEINELTARISALAEALRMKGFYAAGAEGVADAIETAMRSTDQNALLIPVSSTAAFGGGAIKDAIAWLPVQEIANTITQLIALRRQLIEDVYQITGISDIMRGATDANETLGAQQLKSQYGSIRVRERQEEMARVSRDVTRIMAEIVAENFSPEALLSLSQMDIPSAAALQQEAMSIDAKLFQAAQDPNVVSMAQQDPARAQQVIGFAQQRKQELANTVTIEAIVAMLRDQRVRPFVLDIETDSTIQPDEDAEKQRRTEFLTAIGGFIQQSFPIVQQAPETGEFVAEALRFAASGFRAGRQLDGVIDDLAEKIKQAPERSQQPDPAQMAEVEKVKAEIEGMKAETQKTLAEIQKIRAEIGQKQVETEMSGMV